MEADVSDYDVVVIGSGPGGYVAAIRASQAGLETAIVEKEETERLGGTCLLRGCIPTKAMLKTADIMDKMDHAGDFGLSVDNPGVDMEKVDEFRDRVTQKSANGVQYLMKKNDVDVLFGHGRIQDTGVIEVEPLGGEDTKRIETDACILATGSRCLHLPTIDVDHERVIDSDDILNMTEIPDHLIALGAGAVGTEFSSAFLRYGSDVTLVELQDQILPIEDEEASEELQRSFEKQGMDVRTNSKITDVKTTDDGVEAVVESENGDSETIEGSHLLVAVGREPVTDDVGLENTRVEPEDNGAIVVDEYGQTDEEWLYAIGDLVADTPWLAHAASHEGILAAEHIAGRDPHPIDYDRVPNVTFCSPEVASVGLTEAEANERGYDVKTGQFPFSALGKASIDGQTDGFVKIVSEERYEEVLGLHIVGPHATDLITEGTIAMELESTTVELEHTVHPHPTLAEAVGEAAHVINGEPIHI
jgi:dihydrolipoamide dehydrogenase